MSINWALASEGATLAVTRSTGNIDYSGASYLNDGSSGTKTNFYPINVMTNESITYTITLPHAVFLTYMNLLNFYRIDTGAGDSALATIEYYDGAWNSGDSAVISTTPQNLGAGVTSLGITKVRVVVSGISRSGSGGYGDPVNYSKYYLGELTAYGDYYFDKGLRFYDGSSVRTVAVTNLSADSLFRISINGTTYEVPTVPTSHAYASNLYVRQPFGLTTITRVFVDITS